MICRPFQTGRSGYKGRGECAVAGKSNAPHRRDTRRHDECNRSAKSGVDTFCERDLPFLEKYDTKVIVNVCGRTTEDYCEVAERLGDEKRVDMLEINISCPNVKHGGIAFGQNPASVEEITREIKRYAKQPVIMKLSPNVTDITEMARAAQSGGADAISMINTLTGMKIDVERGTFAIANKTGGVSGPAVHPIAVRMVYETAQAVSIPIIGMGGIASAEDALEFILAGATAVAVGTANFRNPMTTIEVLDGIGDYMTRHKVENSQIWSGQCLNDKRRQDKTEKGELAWTKSI